MTRRVKPVSPCQNCKTHAQCVEVNPPPRFHSGWECTYCGEIRWGGVLSEAVHLLIGYTFSNGCVVCWRCHRQHCTARSMEIALSAQTNAPLVVQANASNYPDLPYLSGFMTTLWSDAKEALDRCCDECGVLVDANC